MKYTLLLALSLITFLSALAQPPQGGRPGMKKGAELKGEIFGQVIDSATNEVMEYVTLTLLSKKTNEIVTGQMSSTNGKFTLTDVPAGAYKLKLDFVGYKTKIIDPVMINKEQLAVNLKKITLVNAMVLEEVVISGEKNPVTFEIDKKVVTVNEEDAVAGQSAVEILQNVPSVNVDVDGSVSLRGSSSFTLLIDGKPSSMDVSDALNSIPASTIENIEIITNPSAKYDAEGVSGIINIITKKKKLQGTSLLLNGSIGNYENHAADLNLNINEGKWRFYVTAGFSQNPREADLFSDRRLNTDEGVNQVLAEGDFKRTRKRNNLGTEITFTPNSAHEIMVGAHIGSMSFGIESEVDYDELLNDSVFYQYHNSEGLDITFDVYDLDFQYKYNIGRNAKHYVQLQALHRARDADEESFSDFYTPEDVYDGGTKNEEVGPTDMTRIRLDYSKAYANDSKFEFGGQYQFGGSSDDLDNYNYDLGLGDYVYNEQFSSVVDYSRDILAYYGLYQGKWSKLGYQLGFRMENTDREISSPQFEDFTRIDRWDYFPSGHFTYQLPNEHQLMFNVSRRIQRPRSYFFEPFITWISQYELRRGNPNLEPEYINVAELGWNKSYSRKLSLSLETYYRYTQNSIQRISQVYEDNIFIRVPYNISELYSIGAEPSVTYSPKKWWRSQIGLNLFNYQLIGDFDGRSFDQESFNWNLRMRNSFNFKNDWSLQINPQYDSKTVTPQGEREGFFTLNTSVKKSFLDKKLSLSVMARDLLSTTKNESNSVIGDLTQYELRENRTPIIMLNASLKINNYQKKNQAGENLDDF